MIPAILSSAFLSFDCVSDHHCGSTRPIEPKSYNAIFTCTALRIDGVLDEPVWKMMRSSTAFVDITGDRGKRPRYRTTYWVSWNEDNLFVAARLEELDIRASLTNHDSVVYHDNDFEVFIDPDGDAQNYMEIEVNALNTVFDLLLERPYREHGRAHPDWNAKGLQTAVHLDGTLNDASDTDKGWTVEMAIPWAAICEYSHGPCPPRAGDIWRMNFSRVQWPDDLPGGSAQLVRKGIEDNWVWSPQGEVDMHIPQRWGFVEFVRKGRSNR